MTSQWQRHPNVVWRRSEERVLLQLLDSEEPMILDGSGDAVWRGLAEPRTVAELTALLAEVYGVEQSEIASDVHKVVVDLAMHGLILRSGSQ